jgi:hypothetical protein
VPRQANELARNFIEQAEALESTRVKLEDLLARGEIDLDDIEHVYCGLYLEAFTSFEALLEDLFFGLILGDLISSKSDVVLRVSILPATIAQEIVLAGKSYIEWLPYKENTIRKANIYFQGGYPFTRLEDNDKFSLSRFHSIRNAIGHKSDHARKKFENDVLRSLTLTPRERKPGGFLRSIFRRPSQTQYQISIEELKAIASKLCD